VGHRPTECCEGIEAGLIRHCARIKGLFAQVSHRDLPRNRSYFCKNSKEPLRKRNTPFDLVVPETLISKISKRCERDGASAED
jgi:hypothetical protein